MRHIEFLTRIALVFVLLAEGAQVLLNSYGIKQSINSLQPGDFLDGEELEDFEDDPGPNHRVILLTLLLLVDIGLVGG